MVRDGKRALFSSLFTFKFLRELIKDLDVFIFIIYRTLILTKSFVMKATIKANPNTSLLPVMKKSRNNMRVGLFPILAVQYSVRLEHKRSFIKWKIVYPMKLQDSVEGENETQGSFIIHLPPSQGRAFFNILSTIDSEGEGRFSVARNQSFGTALQQIWRSLGGSQELLYSKTAKDVSASLLLNCCAQIHVEILLPGL